jgi:hypothetical protein
MNRALATLTMLDARTDSVAPSPEWGEALMG